RLFEKWLAVIKITPLNPTPLATTEGTSLRVQQFLMGETPKTGLPHRNAVAPRCIGGRPEI
ncbi:MAG: hypothetical protein V7K35_29305, partial [Nostoc sp.]|uniref:hypothetical protein n=1 Tax=Nostoc sp. TaxID=1180 RepID=UPI002FFC7FEB